MIRYVNLVGQIYNDNDLCFAWYDTIKGEFLDLNGSQIWDSWKEFKSDLIMYMVKGRTPEKMQNEMLDRFKKLFPEPTKQTSLA